MGDRLKETLQGAIKEDLLVQIQRLQAESDKYKTKKNREHGLLLDRIDILEAEVLRLQKPIMAIRGIIDEHKNRSTS